MPLDMPVRSYTERQKELWDLMVELVLQHPAQDVLDALSDAYIHSDYSYDLDSKRMGLLGRELELLGAEYATP